MAVFISYSHDDRQWFEQLKKPLMFLENHYEIEVWEDTRFRTGKVWKKEIEKAIGKCSVAILLVSENFLASEFIIKKELPDILDKARNNGLEIFTLIWDHCVFNISPLAKYQTFNDPEFPLEKEDPKERKKILSDAAIEIKTILEEKEKTIEIPDITFGFSQNILIILAFLSKAEEPIQITTIEKTLQLKRKTIFDSLNFLNEKKWVEKVIIEEPHKTNPNKKGKSSAYWKISLEGSGLIKSFSNTFLAALNPS